MRYQLISGMVRLSKSGAPIVAMLFESPLLKSLGVKTMSEKSIIDPLLNKASELIVEDKIQSNRALHEKMIDDIKLMTDDTKHIILTTMLKMHKYLEDECGDLDISLNTENEILENTEPWYVILDESSDINKRAVRYHYRCNWETDHGVEVIVLNGNETIFVGNCGDASTIERVINHETEKYSFL